MTGFCGSNMLAPLLSTSFQGTPRGLKTLVKKILRIENSNYTTCDFTQSITGSRFDIPVLFQAHGEGYISTFEVLYPQGLIRNFLSPHGLVMNHNAVVAPVVVGVGMSSELERQRKALSRLEVRVVSYSFFGGGRNIEVNIPQSEFLEWGATIIFRRSILTTACECVGIFE